MINQVTTMPDSFHNEVYAEDVSLLSATVANKKYWFAALPNFPLQLRHVADPQS